MPRPDEGLLHAWLDGELEADEAARVEKLVATDAEWSAAAAEARGLIAASSRILSALDMVAGDVIPQGASAAPRRVVPAWMKMAAGVALVAGLGYAARDGIGLTEPKETMPAAEMISLATSSDTTAGRGPDLGSAVAQAAATPTATAPLAGASGAAAAGAVAAGAVAAGAEAAWAARSPTAAPAPVATMDAVANVNADARQRASAEPEARLQDAPRQAPTDTQALRRALGENRLEGVVVTGVTSEAAKQSAERSGAGTRAVQPQAAKSAAALRAPAAALQAEAPPPLPIIEGCFRVRTRARIDTLLTDPKILATDADSIRIEIPSARFAWVRRDSTGALVGRVWWQRGTANLRADPIDCS